MSVVVTAAIISADLAATVVYRRHADGSTFSPTSHFLLGTIWGWWVLIIFRVAKKGSAS